MNSLVAGISEKLLDAARTGRSFTNLQGSIDTALAEISEHLGQSLTLGGSANAVVSGLDTSQLRDLEILSLPPNASARFSGGLTQQAGNAEIMITDAGRLQGGGTLDVKVGDSERRIQFQPGRSISGMAQQINSSKNVGVNAIELNGKLRLTSRSSQSLEATVRPIRTGRNYGDNQLFGVNESQVDNVDLSRLPKGVSKTIQGQVDSVATVARLTYQGSTGGLVSGSANFDLTGDLGTANVETTRGESLISFAEKINNLSAFTGVKAEVNGNELRLVSQLRGDDAEIRLSNVVRQFRPTIEGVNAAQISRFDLQSIADGAEVTLSGTVNTAADTAKLQYQGSGGKVVDTAVFTLSGELGSEQFAIVQGETLTDVRDRINAETESTGVTATIDGDTLQFSGQTVGSSESIQVTLDDITQYVDVDGVNATQIQGFTVNSSEPRSTNTLSGTVDQTATKGQLTYDGFFGAATSNATFNLTGELGTAEIEVSTFQSLSSLRDEINDQTGDTGVVARVSGSTLTLESQSEGSKGIVEVDVTSGSFNMDGGDGNGSVSGTDAQLTINGESVTADGNHVDYADSLGSYSFDVQSGFTGAIDPIEVTTSDGSFDLSGADETGAAYGVDAEANFNGQTYIADGDQFDITIDSAEMSFDVEPGFSGAIDPITLRSEEDEFSVTGGDGNGNAYGQDGQATINGETYTSATDTFAISIGDSSIDLAFVDGYLGAFDAFDIDSEATATRRTGSPSTYSASAKREQFAINGQEVEKVNGRYEFEQDGVRIGFQLAEGFRGSFDNFTITADGAASEPYRASQLSPLTGTTLSATQNALADLFQLATGGKYDSQNADALDAYNVAKEALSNLQSMFGVSSRQGRSLNGLLFDQSA
ncbi:MAG: flagellin hook IN motif-containing protein [Rhodopirellula sp. JB055]|uniref:flagellin hook IN motif-containing protein n=1 Tax=Rhodopirellula sp. JB055 TaxID=3342846 RepID=UPI00370C92C9